MNAVPTKGESHNQETHTHSLTRSLSPLMPITEQGTEPGPTTKRASRKRSRQPDTAFRGVRKRSWGRYVSEIRLPGQKTRVWLGSFGSPQMAARAYDTAAFFLKGASANLNFPELVDSLPRPVSSSRRDIQSAAAKAALEVAEGRSGEEASGCWSGEGDSDEWWDRLGLGEESVWRIEDNDANMNVNEAPLMSLGMESASSLGEFTWNELFNFNFNFNDDVFSFS